MTTKKRRASIGRLFFQAKRYVLTHRLPIIVGGSLFVSLFLWQYLTTGSRILEGDFDYYSQLYEAFRISVLKFHQFPLWNPWMSGGIPLLANPQFGLLSIQALLVVVFGAVYGLKLAYICYAIAGFWGMYALCRQPAVQAGKLRSLLVAGLWVCNGFFAGHSISHFTFSSFFLLPWLFYILMRWRQKNAWLQLVLLEAIIIFSSVHYAFLVINFAFVVSLAFMAIVTALRGSLTKKLVSSFAAFLLKAGAVTITLSAYRLYFAFDYTMHNPRPEALLLESRPGILTVFKAIFLPIGTLLDVPSGTQWGWGEYSMYIGLGAAVTCVIIILYLLRGLITRKRSAIKHYFDQVNPLTAGMLGLGLTGFALAIGDFGPFSPYHILRELPGFSDTRVSARWLSVTIFSIFVLLAAWKPWRKAINVLLAAAVLELFVSFGSPRLSGTNFISLPAKPFPAAYQTYDNSLHHDDFADSPLHSYYYSTSVNTGQVYSDDSIINTLNKVLNTTKCGANTNPKCGLVLSNNATVTYWSPNKLALKRTGPGAITLNMNTEKGWRINGSYPFAGQSQLNPAINFTIPGSDTATYELIYAPKASPSWLTWKLSK